MEPLHRRGGPRVQHAADDAAARGWSARGAARARCRARAVGGLVWRRLGLAARCSWRQVRGRAVACAGRRRASGLVCGRPTLARTSERPSTKRQLPTREKMEFWRFLTPAQ
eukprot:5745221-Prymnesium_polylepis.1